MKENRKLLLVINPFAGQRRANRFLADILRTFNASGWRTEVYVTGARGDATQTIARVGGEFDRIVCIGGDGTLNETIAGVDALGVQKEIGYIPAGTTNDFASTLGLSADLLQAARDAASGRVRTLDLGAFNGRTFTYTASCGAFTRSAYSAPQTAKNALGHLAYVLEGIKDLGSLRPYHLRIERAGSVLEDDYLLCTVTNSTSVAGILRLDERLVTLDDGRFEVMLVRCPTNAVEFSDILRALSTMEIPSENIEFFSAEALSIECDASIEWTLDGEQQPGASRIEIVNRHNALKLVVPGEGRRDEAQ